MVEEQQNENCSSMDSSWHEGKDQIRAIVDGLMLWDRADQ